MTDFEAQRQAQIEKNKARMKELGLLETVRDIQVGVAKAKKAFTEQRGTRKMVNAPRNFERVRRSERVQGKEATNYNEQALQKLGLDDEDQKGRKPRLLRENTTEEIYTLEHMKLLGSATKPWELFVDGYDANGDRVYDKVNGQTCHQCRQKTLGKRTACSCCNSLRGVFCGDCLFMRYGENVEEANANPEWVCPVCRDICNCSNHRIRKGWAPTGTLYRAALGEGFKSVAHYLVLTRLRAEDRPLAAHRLPEGYHFSDDEAEPAATTSADAPSACQHGQSSPSAAAEPAVAVCDQLLSLEPAVPAPADACSLEPPSRTDANEGLGQPAADVAGSRRSRRAQAGEKELCAVQTQAGAAGGDVVLASRRLPGRAARQATMVEVTRAHKRRAAEPLSPVYIGSSKKQVVSMKGSEVASGRGLRAAARKAIAAVA